MSVSTGHEQHPRFPGKIALGPRRTAIGQKEGSDSPSWATIGAMLRGS